MELCPLPTPRLLEQIPAAIRVRHLSPATDAIYTKWIRSFILFHGKCHPRELGAPEVELYLSHLATKGKVAPSTQNQAKASLLFLYKVVFQIDLPWLCHVVQAKAAARLPVVLSPTAPAGQGCGLRAPGDHHPRRQGRQGPDDHAARVIGPPPRSIPTC
ncbi:MAG: site-specific integrase [Verrucomicrobiota bacterium]